MRKIMLVTAILLLFSNIGYADYKEPREMRREKELKELQKRFEWWPTEPGQKRPWGNRGYVYVYKIIFDYKEEELPPPKPKELRPSLLIKKIIENVKVYFDYNSAVLREDARKILLNAAGTLKRNPETSILITGNCDRRGSEAYNDKLGRRRGDSVKKFMLENGINEENIRIYY